jgi:hypothetical protein
MNFANISTGNYPTLYRKLLIYVSVTCRLFRIRSMYATATRASSIPNKAKKVPSFFTVPGGNIFKVLALTNEQDATSPVKQNADI